jgi:hypothetical protein
MKNNLSPAWVTALLLFAGGATWICLQTLSDGETTHSASVTESATEFRERSSVIWDERRLIELSERDPLKAIGLSQELVNAAERQRILSAALESLSRSNPALAAGVVAGLPAGDFQQIAAGQVATAFAGVDSVGAFSWAQTLADDQTRLRAVREVAAVWAETDPKAAAVSVGTLDSEREKQLGALAVATVWIRNDPRAALAWAGTLEPLDARALVSGSAVQTWAERDAPAAMDWLANQSADFQSAIDPDTRLGIIGKWAVQDPEAAREFVSKMTPDGRQARAVGLIAEQLAKNDPVATMQWALTLPWEAVSNGAFSAAFRQWREAAPERAEAWLTAANLTAEEKLRLVNYP